MFLYVGTFTDGTGATGISVFRVGSLDGALTLVQTVGDMISPSFLALDPAGRFLYAVERRWTDDQAESGAVTVFAVDPVEGTLTTLGRRRSGGVSPCYVSTHPSGRFVLVAHYGSGQVSVLPVGHGDALDDAVDVVQHVGVGPDPERQASPHAHCVVTDPSGWFVLACDLGVDRIMVYRLDPVSGKLVPNAIPHAQVSSGAGPRHLAFHPNGQLAYVINEIDSTISAFAFDPNRGALRIVQTISALPSDFAGASHTAQILVHPSGRFLYGSNRGDDSIAIFDIEASTGRLSLIGHESSRGISPRNFAIDPSGRLLLAANQTSNTIVAFRIDLDSGKLTATDLVTETLSPVCLVFSPGSNT